jgi:hypothetical protein
MARYCRGFFKDTEKRAKFWSDIVKEHKKNDTESKPDTMLQVALERLKTKCSDWDSQPGICHLILSMDEIDSIFEGRSFFEDAPSSIWSRLRSVLSRLNREDLCVLALSTNNSIAALAPPRSIAPSLREKSEHIIQPTPFTELSFDVHIIDKPLTPFDATLETVGSFKFTAAFGRPLYVSPIVTSLCLT